MFRPGIGFTRASCSAYCIQNGVRFPGFVSPGSSQAGGIVTYTANLISPSGLVCALDKLGPTIVAATPRSMAEASFCHSFITAGFLLAREMRTAAYGSQLSRRMRSGPAGAFGRRLVVQDGIMA